MFSDNLSVAGSLTASIVAQGGASVFALPTPTGLKVVAGVQTANFAQGFYYYRVSAINAFGESLASPEVAYFAPIPTAQNGMVISWLPVVGATGYKLYGRTTGTETLMVTIVGGLNSSFNDNLVGSNVPATPPNGALPTANTSGHLIVEAGYAKLFVRAAPAAADLVSVHAALAATAANTFPGPITNPPVIRNLQVDFSAGWDGGNVTIIGTDQFSEAPVTEVFTAVPATTVVGVKIYRTIFSITKGTIGTTGSASVGNGGKLGIQGKLLNTADAVLFANNVPEAVVLDSTYNGYVPTTAPNGAVNFKLLANVKE